MTAKTDNDRSRGRTPRPVLGVRTSVAARLVGVNARTLRRWAGVGLVTTVVRSHGDRGHWVWTEEAREEARGVLWRRNDLIVATTTR